MLLPSNSRIASILHEMKNILHNIPTFFNGQFSNLEIWCGFVWGKTADFVLES